MPAWHRSPAAPARHRSPAEPAPRSGFFPGKKFQSLPWGEDCSTLFFANGCEAPAARHRSPAAPARHRSPRQGIPRKKIQGLPPSILLSPQDCLLQSCCHPRIEGNSTRNSTRGNSEKMGHACFQFRTPRGQQPKNGWCLFPVPRHFESISATYAFQHHIPARHRSLPAAPPARHRSPAEPAPR